MKKVAMDDAFASVSLEVRELSLGDEVDRVKGPLDPLEFHRTYVAANKPCIITDAITHWPALHLWTNDYLAQKIGDQLVTVDLTPDGHGDAIVEAERYRLIHEKEEHNNNSGGEEESSSKEATAGPPCARGGEYERRDGGGGGRRLFVMPEERKMRVAEFLELLRGSREERGRGVPYAQHQNGSLLTEYSVLATDAERDIPWASAALGCQPEAVNLWIGDERAVTSFHKDHYENLYAVVAGEKHFTLLPPADVHRMYVAEFQAGRYRQQQGGRPFSIVLLSPPATVPWVSVDPYPTDRASAERRFPRFFNGPPPLTCTVRAGEMLFLPSMWFHHVCQTPDLEGRTIAVNFWYDMQYDVRYAYFNLLRAMTSLRDSMDDEAEEDGEASEGVSKRLAC